MRYIAQKRIMALILLLSCLFPGFSLAEQVSAAHDVSFIDWNGEVLHTFSIANGQTLDPESIEPIEREGYPFLFWYDTSMPDALQAFDFSAPIKQDLMLAPCFGAYTGEPTVVVLSDLGSVIVENEPVTLTAELHGFEGKAVSLQWQYFDGKRWRDVKGANDYTYTYEATMETVNYEWRVEVKAR